VRPGWARLGILLALLPVVSTACDAPFGLGDQHERTVLIDYKHDEFTSAFLRFFPQVLTVRAGDAVVFKQSWSGEPHTVTMGNLVDRAFQPILPLLKNGVPPGPPPPEAAAFIKLPSVYSQDNQSSAGPAPSFQQLAAQPCYVDSGAPPSDQTKPCPRRAQPAFNGRQSYYNSGFIPYQGLDGNIFRVRIAADAAPGTYNYYCAIHGPGMRAQVNVKGKDAGVPSQDEVNRQAQAEIQKAAQPALAALHEAQAGKSPIHGAYFAGYGSEKLQDVEINQFIPKTIHAGVGQKVTWIFVGGGHTVSFDVPSYLPIYTITKDGTVSQNPQTVDPIASPAPPPQNPNDNGPPPGTPPTVVDGGNYDGSHFISSGLFPGGAGTTGYSLTFNKAGTYKYACLVHPNMVGEVDVR
jgi:plastocyanin